jgi:hypothetical protein
MPFSSSRMRVLFCVVCFLARWTYAQQSVDLRDAVIVCPASASRAERKAVQMLDEEVTRRTRLNWPITNSLPASNAPAIVICTSTQARDFAPPLQRPISSNSSQAPEGFHLSVSKTGGRSAVLVLGNDERGVLFGVGRLLRELRMEPDSVMLADNLNITTAPKYRLRGHQLGYRPKCNSYDAWDLPVWEQYIRDLAVFGCNAIELIPPRSDDEATSPHFPRPPLEMMVGMSALANDYGLDVWAWFPAMDPDYSNPRTISASVQEWGDLFSKLPRLDAVFVPGGDPGHTQPKVLLALLEKQTANLHRYHPKAQMWVSPQGFNQVWMDEFLGILNDQHPSWLTGIVFGPQVRLSLPRLRDLVPKQYPIRHYPDITHSRQCQYPVPDWDIAYAVTEGRECINPRPIDEALIFRQTQPYTIGFLTYSEGCNDDVNKFIWSGLGWDPDLEVKDILRQYSRYFIGQRYTESFAEGLMALERDWRGPLAANDGVEKTFEQFRTLERRATPADLKNWRFQQALFRAYYDESVRRRQAVESATEARALDLLARGNDPLSRINAAETALVQPTNAFDHTRIFTLAEALFQSIGMQLSVEKYKAIAIDRGASLDTLGYPLNNRAWLKFQFRKIRALPSDAERKNAIERIIHWTDPGPGGFYDDLGNPAKQPHLVTQPGFTNDPGCVLSPRVDSEEDLVFDEPLETAGVPRRLSWMDHAETLYDTPLRMHYDSLDRRAHYRLRVVYGGDNFKRKIRLVANHTIEIHPLMPKPYPMAPIEFALPPAATSSGGLDLTWSGDPGLGGNGRSCQVSEVWLIKELAPAKH